MVKIFPLPPPKAPLNVYSPSLLPSTPCALIIGKHHRDRVHLLQDLLSRIKPNSVTYCTSSNEPHDKVIEDLLTLQKQNLDAKRVPKVAIVFLECILDPHLPIIEELFAIHEYLNISIIWMDNPSSSLNIHSYLNQSIDLIFAFPVSLSTHVEQRWFYNNFVGSSLCTFEHFLTTFMAYNFNGNYIMVIDRHSIDDRVISWYTIPMQNNSAIT